MAVGDGQYGAAAAGVEADDDRAIRLATQREIGPTARMGRDGDGGRDSGLGEACALQRFDDPRTLPTGHGLGCPMLHGTAAATL